MVYVSNVFITQMVGDDVDWFHREAVLPNSVPEEAVNVINHANITLHNGDTLFVAQVVGDMEIRMDKYTFGDPELSSKRVVDTYCEETSEVTIVPSGNGNIIKPRETRCTYSFSSYYVGGLSGYIKPID